MCGNNKIVIIMPINLSGAVQKGGLIEGWLHSNRNCNNIVKQVTKRRFNYGRTKPRNIRQ